VNRIPANKAKLTDGTTLTIGSMVDDGLVYRSGTALNNAPSVFPIGEMQYKTGTGVVGITNPGDNVGDSLAQNFTLDVGTYLIFAIGTFSASLTTIGCRFGFKASGGLVASEAWVYAKVNTATTTMETSINNGALDNFTSGNSGSTTARPWTLYAMLVVTTAGTATLWGEVEAGGTLTINTPRGWAMRIA
jgi:hypothetical protein